jgi:ankyrin repeat protein
MEEMLSDASDALYNSSVEQIKRLIERGLDVNSRLGDETLLMKAIKYNQYEIARLLIDNGADILLCDMFGRNALAIAKMTKSNDIFALLKKKQLDINK